jgi:copper chaperone CopZ
MAPPAGLSRTLCAGMTVPVKRTLALLCASLLGAGLSACGNTVSVSTAFKGEDHEVAQAIANLQADATTANEQRICANDLANAVVVRLSSANGGCRKAIKNQLGEVDSFEVSVQSIQVSAAGARRTASARVKSVYLGKTRLSTLLLVKEGGKWKISSLQ